MCRSRQKVSRKELNQSLDGDTICLDRSMAGSHLKLPALNQQVMLQHLGLAISCLLTSSLMLT